ncbi:MAG: hypothetical protein WBZ36_26470 [Candidatus Nitrosopolaris sp.]
MDDSFFDLVDEAAEFVKKNGYEDFVLSLKQDTRYKCHKPGDIDRCANNIISKLSAAGVTQHYTGGGFKLSFIGELTQRRVKKENELSRTPEVK